MQKKYEKAGFVLIAQHRQGADLKEKALGLLRSNGVNYTVTQGGSVPGDTSRGIPHAFLFDWTGKCVGEGHPNELYSKIDELMAKAPPFVTGGKEFKDEAVAKLAGMLRSPKNYGKVIGDLADLLKKGDNAEASYLKERLEAYGNGLLESAEKAVTENALEAQRGFKEASANFKGTEIGDKAKKRLKELKRDKAFKKELKAAKYLAVLENQVGLYHKIKGHHGNPVKQARAIQGILHKMKKKFGETKAFEKAMKLAEGCR